MTATSPRPSPKKWRSTKHTYADIVDHYVCCKKESYLAELAWFKHQPTASAAIARAAIARSSKGKRLSHQKCIARQSLFNAHQILMRNVHLLTQAKTFNDLHKLIYCLVNSVHGIGSLYIYDTSLRIAAYLNRTRSMMPTQVYLHAGSLQGAKNIARLNLSVIMSASKFPAPICSLSPHEIENLLCLYKDCLQ
jgi:hypothetical protein